MTQAICDITTDEVNVDVVVEPQADTMVEVANRAGGMEQVFHDNTLIGNGNSIDLGVNTDIIATKDYVDEKKVDAYTKSEIDNKITVINTGITGNAQAIQKTRDDMNAEDGRLQTQITAHASELTTLRGNQASLGDQVSGIEEKIPGSASATNPLVTKEDLKSIDLEGYATTEYVNAREQEIRDDVNQADSELQYQITAQASAITANTSSINSVKAVIPQGTSETNQLINKQQLLDEEMDIRDDLNESVSELQTQITAQAAEIATKQDQLVAGDNIVISGNTISATGTGGVGFDMQVVDQLPATGEKGVIYLVPKDGTAPDVHDEYVWIDATQTFELIGTTQVDLTDYVKNTDYATETNKAGIVYPIPNAGLRVTSSGGMYIANAPKDYIDKRTSDYRPITPTNLDYAVKTSVTTNTITLTDDEKTAARTWLGAVGNTDYAGLNKVGIVGCSDAAATMANVYGYLQASTITLASYKAASGFMFVGKGTLENIKNDLVKRAVTENDITLTDEEKAAAQAWLGVESGGGDIDISHINNESIQTKDLTVGTSEGTLNLSITAGVATIATNNGLDIVSQTKFDTAPTTDDTTTWANANDTSLVTKRQVATALSESGDCGLIIRRL